MGQSANVCDVAPHDRHGQNIGTSGTSVEARTESPCCVGTYELGVRTVAVTDLDEAEGVGEGALALALLVSFYQHLVELLLQETSTPSPGCHSFL